LTTYADTSVFVSLYVNDRHSAQVRQIFGTRAELWFTQLHHAEWAHAIEQHVFRRFMSPSEAQRIHRQLGDDVKAGLWVESPLPQAAFSTAVDLARRHVARINTRTLDTLHVACALELKATRFWTFDDRQLKLAKAAGLRTT
jgi:predicted nucleic acid-binding protein